MQIILFFFVKQLYVNRIHLMLLINVIYLLILIGKQNVIQNVVNFSNINYNCFNAYYIS